MDSDRIFSPSFGNRPSRLVGRDEMLDVLMRGLASQPGSKERAVVMFGQRGSGKTVLLWELADRATRAGYVVATPTIASDGMLARIVEKIQDAGERHVKQRPHLTGGSVGALGFSAGLQFTSEVQKEKSFQYKLTQLSRRLTDQGKGILVLVDELQANSPEVRQLVIAYQELVGEGLDVSLVMAGLPGAVSATLNDKVLTFLNRASKMNIDPLPFSEVDAFFKSSFDKLGIRIDRELRRQASIAVNGSPYLLQLIGYNLVLYASDERVVDQGALEDALESAQDEFENDVCKTTLAALSETDGAFLATMARIGTPARMSDIAKEMGVTSDYAQKYRRRLIDAGVIEASERGMVSFAVPYMESYLSKE